MGKKDSCSFHVCVVLPPSLQNSVLSTSTNRSRNSPMLEHTSLGQNSIQNGKDRYGEVLEAEELRHDISPGLRSKAAASADVA